MEKMIKISKQLDTFARAVFWVLTAVGVLMAAGLVYVAVSGNWEFLGIDQSVSLGYIEVNIPHDQVSIMPAHRPGSVVVASGNSVAQAQPDFTSLLIMMGAQLALGLVISFIGIHLVRGILKPMMDGQPFAQTVAKNLRKLAWVSLIGGIVMQVAQVVWQKLILTALDLPTLFNPEKVAGYTVNWRFDLTFLLISMILFLLSFVFRYGEELQRQSDETL